MTIENQKIDKLVEILLNQRVINQGEWQSFISQMDKKDQEIKAAKRANIEKVRQTKSRRPIIQKR